MCEQILDRDDHWNNNCGFLTWLTLILWIRLLMIVPGFPMDEDIPWGQGKVQVWGCDDSTSLL
jgi:hypothetical protein